MGRAVITAEAVQQARSAGRLEVPSGALVTPLAKDTAAELGVQLVTGAGQAGSPGASAAVSSPDDLSARVSQILSALLATGGAGVSGPAPGQGGAKVKLTHHEDVRTEPFPYPGPPEGMGVETVDIVTADDGAPVAAGYMTLTKGSFPWELTYDEVQVVLEGELHIGTPDGTNVGRPGDVIYVPKGSKITFGTPNWTKFVYVTFPANWEEGIQ